MMTFVEKYKELRKEGIRPSQCKIIAESYVSRETLRLMEAERIPLADVKEMVFFIAAVELRSTCERFTIRVEAVIDDDYNLERLMPEASMQPCSCEYDGWGRERQERGEFIYSKERQTCCVDLGETLTDVMKYAPPGMSKQVKREWAVSRLNDRKDMAVAYLEDQIWGIGVRVTVSDAPEEYSEVEDTVEASLWGLDVMWDSQVQCVEYIQEVCEELIDEVGSQLDDVTASSNAA